MVCGAADECKLGVCELGLCAFTDVEDGTHCILSGVDGECIGGACVVNPVVDHICNNAPNECYDDGLASLRESVAVCSDPTVRPPGVYGSQHCYNGLAFYFPLSCLCV